MQIYVLYIQKYEKHASNKMTIFELYFNYFFQYLMLVSLLFEIAFL